MTLTPTQKAILEALAGGAEYFVGRYSGQAFTRTITPLATTRVSGRVHEALCEKGMIHRTGHRDATIVYTLTPLGRHALSDSGGGR